MIKLSKEETNGFWLAHRIYLYGSLKRISSQLMF